MDVLDSDVPSGGPRAHRARGLSSRSHCHRRSRVVLVVGSFRVPASFGLRGLMPIA